MKARIDRSIVERGQGILAAAKAMMAESSSAGRVPQGFPAPGAGGGHFRSVTVMLPTHLIDAWQQMTVSVMEESRLDTSQANQECRNSWDHNYRFQYCR